MAAGAAAAAAAARQRMLEEEEQMTPYTREELESDWEFKIVRANTNVFGSQANFQKLVEEEDAHSADRLRRAGLDHVDRLPDRSRPLSSPASLAVAPGTPLTTLPAASAFPY